MTIEFHCHYCQQLLRTADERAGQMAKCPGCGESVTVPQRQPLSERQPFAETKTRNDDPFALPESSENNRKPCPMCGEMIINTAVKCRFCGEMLGSHASYSQPSDYRRLDDHRGGLILALGILSWVVCAIAAPVAWIMGNEDIKEMDAGRMDPEGRGLTQAGRIIGMVHCILWIVAVVVVVGFLLIAAAAG